MIETYGPPTQRTELLRRLAEGQSLRAICASEGMPDKATVLRWCAADEAFRAEYAAAREAGCDAIADEILDIADDSSGDTVETEHGPRLDSEFVQRSRLRVDARKWLLSKQLPKKYGDKVTTELTGADGGPVASSITVKFVKPEDSRG